MNIKNFEKYVGLSDMAADLPVFDSADGITLIDSDGKKYVDLCLGGGALPLGHGDPVVESMTTWQMKDHLRLPVYGMSDGSPITQFAMALALRINKLPRNTGDMADNQVAFMESGVSPAEFAVTAGKNHTRREKVGVLVGSSHADHHGAFQPEGSDRSVESSLALQGGLVTLDPFSPSAIEDIDSLPWEDISSFFVELVQTSNGVRRLPTDFVQALRERCRQDKTLFVVDETNTGMGRTGRMFAQETYGVTGDVTVLGGSLGGGFPLGAVVAPREVMESVSPQGIQQTLFGGHAISCSSGLITMSQITEGAMTNARQMSEHLRSGFSRLVDEFPNVLKSVEGEGLMFSLKLQKGVSPASLELEARKAGLLLCFAWPYTHDVPLFAFPPLTITKNEASHALHLFRQALLALEVP